MRGIYLLLILLLVTTAGRLRAQAPTGRPKVGLTLSGGGARGLAHIGLLKALDSAHVHIDYVTGTSFGAVVGSLYAAGYSGAEIEQIANRLDWNSLLTNAVPLTTVALFEKNEFGRYLVELPFAHGQVQLPGGLIESEELWLKLSELLFPFYRTKNFADFPRGFRCVATDVVTGEPVDLKDGEIVSAVRASMAIPTVFSPVQYQGHQLVDGGVVRNFPVSEARAMGASYVIGSNVSTGTATIDNLRNALAILTQISFFKDNSDFLAQRPLCNLYVDYPLAGYGTGSFAASAAIIDLGVQKGRALFPRLRTWTDSLDARYGPPAPQPPAPRADSVYVTGYEVTGIEPHQVPPLLRLMRFQPNRYYSAGQLTECLRRAFGIRYFRKITYTLRPVAGSATAATIVFEVARDALTHIGLEVHYNSLTGIGLIASVSAKDLLLPYSTSQVAANLGESPRLRLKHTQYLTSSKQLVARVLAQGEQVSITTYRSDFTKAGLYTQGYALADGQLARTFGRSQAVGLGTRYEHLAYHPEITAQLQPGGRLNLLTSYLFYEANTLNTRLYPTRGRKVCAEVGYVYDQRPAGGLLDSVSGSPAGVGRFSYQPYPRLRLAIEQYVPLTGRGTLLLQGQAGANFHYQQAVTNDLVVGGLTSVIRNQMTFAGLPEAALSTSSAAAVLVGYQQAVGQNLFVTAKANALYHDFIPGNVQLQPARVIYGGSLTAGLKTFLGPVEASLMYSDVAKKILPYFNIGLPFGYR